MPALKEEIAKFYDGLTTDHVIVTSGGSEAIFSIYAALCKPGDHMVCEAPNYPSNYGIPEGLGMEYSLCHMKFEDDYRLNMEAIKSMVTDKTKVTRECFFLPVRLQCVFCASHLCGYLHCAGFVHLPSE